MFTYKTDKRSAYSGYATEKEAFIFCNDILTVARKNETILHELVHLKQFQNIKNMNFIDDEDIDIISLFSIIPPFLIP